KARFAASWPARVSPSSHDFTLISIRSEGQFNSIIYEEDDSYRGVRNRWTVLMNQTDALELGVSEGDKVDVCSDNGEMKALSVKLFDLPRSCIAAYYPEANCLTTRVCDPRSHTPQFKSVPVSIAPAA
ncbi:MAG: anaerobic selenocysteine-containing dehydrogenase, partial [Bacteroidia bacterium]